MDYRPFPYYSNSIKVSAAAAADITVFTGGLPRIGDSFPSLTAFRGRIIRMEGITVKYPMEDGNGASTTKDRIMLEAAILFARRGYAAVSIRDIAKKADIKAASIYNYFSGKEELFDIIVDNISGVYKEYFVRIEKEMKNASNFEQVLEYLFSELKKVYSIFIYYGITLVATEQFRNRKARDVFTDVLMRVGIDYSRAKFDMCVEKGWVKPFDTKAVATLFSHSVIVGTLMRTHEDMKHETPYDVTDMFASLQRLILNSVEIIE